MRDEAITKKLVEKTNGLLWYTGRIAETSNVSSTFDMSDFMKDLSSKTFCVLLASKHSSLAYNVINKIMLGQKHAGAETVWRYVLQMAYIILGRKLMKKIKLLCQHCRYIKKKTMDVEVEPVSQHRFKIAPSFHATQMNLAGPFKTYSSHIKRASYCNLNDKY